MPTSLFIQPGSSPTPAGSGSATFRASGVIAKNQTQLANGADTNFLFPFEFVIPAGTLVNNGDVLELRHRFTLSAAASTKTYQTNFNYTATGVGGFTGGTNIQSNATAVSSQDIWVICRITRLSNTSIRVAAIAILGAGAQQEGATQTISSLNLSTTNYPLGISMRDGTGNAAAITFQEAALEYIPVAA